MCLSLRKNSCPKRRAQRVRDTTGGILDIAAPLPVAAIKPKNVLFGKPLATTSWNGGCANFLSERYTAEFPGTPKIPEDPL
jgi:hypothetical protein